MPVLFAARSSLEGSFSIAASRSRFDALNAAATRFRYLMLVVLHPGSNAVIARLASLDGIGCSVWLIGGFDTLIDSQARLDCWAGLLG